MTVAEQHGSWMAGLCIRDAIEYLIKDESDSALVHAIVQDTGFRLAFAILEAPTEEEERARIRIALITAFEPYKKQFDSFMQALMVQEMVDTEDWNNLFRSKPAVTSLVRVYSSRVGDVFLKTALLPTIQKIGRLDTKVLEVNPHRLVTSKQNATTSKEALEKLLHQNQKKLQQLAQQALDSVIAAASEFPPSVARVYSILKREMMRILLQRRESLDDDDGDVSSGRPRCLSIDQPERLSFCNQSFIANNTISEESAFDEVMIHLGGFVFLRHICPALLMPHKYDLSDGQRPSPSMQRNLTLLAKLFQSLSSAVEYGSHEVYMMPFNHFLANNRSKLMQFYIKILHLGENASSYDSDATVECTSPKIETELQSIRGILLKYLEKISNYVENEHVKLAEHRTLAVGASVASVVGQRQMRRKRECLNGKEVKSIESEQTPSSTTLRCFQVKDLERLLRQQKEYEAKLKASFRPSTEGLNLLLTVNDAKAGTIWKKIRQEKYGVQIYRRQPMQNGYIELKACIGIKGSSRHVFRYLRTLESINEWDERASHIEKIEPVSSSSILLYRSHAKLSLWPSWIVKPRDSCDLHTFISQTGRDRTHAVVMESVPNPDYPEFKGVVRMSYATGGYLIEPYNGLLSDDGIAKDIESGKMQEGDFIDLNALLEYHQDLNRDSCRNLEPSSISKISSMFTRLTCVVRADFKGSLPRSLAESVCYRQVLSVKSIRKHIEAGAAHLRSQWV